MAWRLRFPSAIHPLLFAVNSFPALQFPLTKSYQPAYEFLMPRTLPFFGNDTSLCAS